MLENRHAKLHRTQRKEQCQPYYLLSRADKLSTAGGEAQCFYFSPSLETFPVGLFIDSSMSLQGYRRILSGVKKKKKFL